MLIEQQVKHLNALNLWFKTPLGLSVAHAFSQVLDPLTYLQGGALLQLGGCGDEAWLQRLRFNYQWIASPTQSNVRASLQCALTQLPLMRNSVDCVLVPLTLELAGNGLALLDEVDRVLKPMGHVVIVSINPWSVWGAAIKCGLMPCYHDRRVALHSPYYLNRIFLQRGYKQCALTNFYYTPPINNKKILEKLTFLNAVGHMLWPIPGGFYCYVAQKYEYIPLTFLMDFAQKRAVVPC